MYQNDKFDWYYLFIKSLSVFFAIIVFGIVAGLGVVIWRYALGL